MNASLMPRSKWVSMGGSTTSAWERAAARLEAGGSSTIESNCHPKCPSLFNQRSEFNARLGPLDPEARNDAKSKCSIVVLSLERIKLTSSDHVRTAFTTV